MNATFDRHILYEQIVSKEWNKSSNFETPSQFHYYHSTRPQMLWIIKLSLEVATRLPAVLPLRQLHLQSNESQTLREERHDVTQGMGLHVGEIRPLNSRRYKNVETDISVLIRIRLAQLMSRHCSRKLINKQISEFLTVYFVPRGRPFT